jgi:phospholipase C
MRNAGLVCVVLSLLGCGGSTPNQELVITPDAGDEVGLDAGDDTAEEEASFADSSVTDSVATDSATSDSASDTADVGMAGTSRIKHVVVVVQENHTFDAYFGRWCTAATGSSPTCTSGPACCERAPDKDPAGNAFIALDDTSNGAYDPNHTQTCELS